MNNTNIFIEKLMGLLENIPHLSDGERKEFINRMARFERLFTPKNESADTFYYEIKIKDHKSFVRKHYPVPMTHRESVGRKLEEMEEAKIIERCDSCYCNPLRIVIKKDGSVRVCLDARYINEIVEDDHEGPPLINELLQKFYGTTYMTTADLETGYWQIPLHPNSRKYTAFVYDSRMYRFCRVPFGLKTAGSAFIRAINFALGNRFSEVLTVYIDNFLIATRGSFNDHLNALESVFEILQNKNFTLKLDKSLFCQKKIKFLGHELSTTGIRPLADKLDIIKNFQKPKNVNELQQFLGICTYYRNFTACHSNLIEPFRDLLKAKRSWSWDESHDLAFQKMKLAFVKCVELGHHIPNAKYILQTDASDTGVSGILYQYDSDGNPRIASLVSRCLGVAELNYTTTEKELLAIVYSVTKLRVYLLGREFEIITDHKGLIFLKSTAYLSARLIRWCLILQQYHFTISYCKGSDNIIADFFSRNPRGIFEDHSSKILSIDVLSMENQFEQVQCWSNEIDMGKNLTDSLKNLSVLQKEDDTCKLIFERVSKGDKLEFYVIEKDVLFRRDKFLQLWQVVIPAFIIDQLIEQIHTGLGHPGVYKTIMYLRQYYY